MIPSEHTNQGICLVLVAFSKAGFISEKNDELSIIPAEILSIIFIIFLLMFLNKYTHAEPRAVIPNVPTPAIKACNTGFKLSKKLIIPYCMTSFYYW